MAKLRIERIECIPLSMPLPRTFRGSNYYMTHRCTIITRVYTAEGIVGECYNGDEFETQGEVLKIIAEEIAPKLIGMDAFNIEGCWQAMRKPSYNILRDRKLAMCAQACVDSALWDAVGKALDTPLYKIWGGFRDSLQVICIAGYYEGGKTWPISAARWNGSRPAMPAASSRWAGAPRRRMPIACARRARPWARISS
jgi:D-arabinonate dehydratase